MGTVEVGKAADLVLLDANPIEDIRNADKIEDAVVCGRYLDRSTWTKCSRGNLILPARPQGI